MKEKGSSNKWCHCASDSSFTLKKKTFLDDRFLFARILQALVRLRQQICISAGSIKTDRPINAFSLLWVAEQTERDTFKETVHLILKLLSSFNLLRVVVNMSFFVLWNTNKDISSSPEAVVFLLSGFYFILFVACSDMSNICFTVYLFLAMKIYFNRIK